MFWDRRRPQTFVAVKHMRNLYALCTRFAHLASIGFRSQTFLFGFEVYVGQRGETCLQCTQIVHVIYSRRRLRTAPALTLPGAYLEVSELQIFLPSLPPSFAIL
jgi:hypothetical protein